MFVGCWLNSNATMSLLETVHAIFYHFYKLYKNKLKFTYSTRKQLYSKNKINQN